MCDLHDKTSIVFGRRCVIETTGFIHWVRQKPEKSAFTYVIHNEGKIHDQNVFECKNIDSIHHLETYTLAEYILPVSLPIVNDNPILVKITQSAVISGINSDLDYWATHDWTTKAGKPVKYPELWKIIYEFRKNHPIIAFPLEEHRAQQLQSQAKSCIAATQSNIVVLR
jgi:hypothetical protein